MITRLKLKPGQKGTKALTEKYGEDFVCVRYRYDEPSRTRIKTVEIIVESGAIAFNSYFRRCSECLSLKMFYACWFLY